MTDKEFKEDLELYFGEPTNEKGIVIEKEEYRILKIVYEFMLPKFDEDKDFMMNAVMGKKKPDSIVKEMKLRISGFPTYMSDLLSKIDRAVARLETEGHEARRRAFVNTCETYLRRFTKPPKALPEPEIIKRYESPVPKPEPPNVQYQTPVQKVEVEVVVRREDRDDKDHLMTMGHQKEDPTKNLN